MLLRLQSRDLWLEKKKKSKLLINDMNTRANGLAITDSYLTLFRE